MTHICVGNLTIIVSDNAWSAPSHYLNQWWNIVDSTFKNKLQWNFNRISNICFMKMRLNVSSLAVILSRLQCVKRKTYYGSKFRSVDIYYEKMHMRTYRNFGIWDFNIPKNGVNTTNVDALVPVGTVSSTAMVWTEWTDYSYTPFYPS